MADNDDRQSITIKIYSKTGAKRSLFLFKNQFGNSIFTGGIRNGII